ncbi:5-oxoprolinase subunit PxpB [Terasakiella sp. SH-1]|uniref:5-oxoprolinase subunit PxpB n=1 Tax=Terasakiella sp. SH-1 TaxID=2560057 RepID=UPI001074826B|nr:5-oxoprolinase subunit PxpB [Terasakiella sp. SH-1]
MNMRVLYLGDRAVTFEFADHISVQANLRVLAIHALVGEALGQGKLDGIIETVPTFRSITVHYDPLRLYPDDVEKMMAPYLSPSDLQRRDVKEWEFPCCYEGGYGEDLNEVAQCCSLSPQEVIDIHSSQQFEVFMLGFLPGFGFLGQLDERLVLPRRKEPRIVVPKGAVAIADKLSAVYPSQSPGGWHLIGRTPVEFFDLTKERPALLQAGDKVRFYPISRAEFELLEAEGG